MALPCRGTLKSPQCRGRDSCKSAPPPHLAQHGLGLHAHALDAVHHHQGTVSDTQGSRHLGREVHVACTPGKIATQ